MVLILSGLDVLYVISYELPDRYKYPFDPIIADYGFDGICYGLKINNSIIYRVFTSFLVSKYTEEILSIGP
jgi:hypothetical protein